jgi:hypothetical protein
MSFCGSLYKTISTAVLVLGLGAVCVAGPITPGSIGSTTIALNGAFGGVSNGAITGPYQFTDSSNNTFLTMCFDAQHDIYFGEQYQTTEYSLASLASLPANAPVEFKGSTLTFNVGNGNQTFNYVQIYEANAWLESKLLADFNPNNDTMINQALGIELQDAAWALFDPNGGWASGPNASTIQNYEQLALLNSINGNQSGINYNNFVIYSPDTVGQGQLEMITTTPEPASLTLFGTGLLTFGGLIRRRLKKRA